MATEQLEIERKFDVGAEFVVPGLTGIPGIATVGPPEVHDLAAVYSDTVDLRLVRARVTLRRRTGGPDEGWHLKLPAGEARRELHLPLGESAGGPPQEFRDAVAEIVDGEALVPVVELRTRRVVTPLRAADGRVLAEVADDTVTATVLPAAPGEEPEVRSWREIEVELVAGEEPFLADVGAALVAAGARPSARVSKLAFALAGRLDRGPG